ncbi:hypothetical protein J1N35_028441 [Gossypium stocksii]|uniref:Uncharacterized protein n=1 Tax=Gossypium stocksii TaxID=47602 RepID=A0A9D3UXW8_9ROSI|nr:hypothetical protein J1N35_028441 [Gossypium stocksii]
MGVTPKIAPSMLSSSFANLASEAKRMLDFSADWLHMDIMIKYSSSLTGHFLDCHLMVTNLIDYVEPLGKACAFGFTSHVEVSKGLLNKNNWPAGLKVDSKDAVTCHVTLP